MSSGPCHLRQGLVGVAYPERPDNCIQAQHAPDADDVVEAAAAAMEAGATKMPGGDCDPANDPLLTLLPHLLPPRCSDRAPAADRVLGFGLCNPHPGQLPGLGALPPPHVLDLQSPNPGGALVGTLTSPPCWQLPGNSSEAPSLAADPAAGSGLSPGPYSAAVMSAGAADAGQQHDLAPAPAAGEQFECGAVGGGSVGGGRTALALGEGFGLPLCTGRSSGSFCFAPGLAARPGACACWVRCSLWCLLVAGRTCMLLSRQPD